MRYRSVVICKDILATLVDLLCIATYLVNLLYLAI